MGISLKVERVTPSRVTGWCKESLLKTISHMVPLFLMTLFYLAVVDGSVVLFSGMAGTVLGGLQELLTVGTSSLAFGIYLVAAHSLLGAGDNPEIKFFERFRKGANSGLIPLIYVSLACGFTWAVLNALLRAHGVEAPENQQQVADYTLSVLIIPGSLIAMLWVAFTSVIGQWSLPTMIVNSVESDEHEVFKLAFDAYRHYLFTMLGMMLVWVSVSVILFSALPLTPMLVLFIMYFTVLMYVSSFDMYNHSNASARVDYDKSFEKSHR